MGKTKEDFIGLTDEEADKALAEELKAENTDEESASGSEDNPDEETEGDDEKEDKGGDKGKDAEDEEAADADAEKEEGEEKGENDGEEKITHDPLKDTKARLTKEQQQNAKLRKENEELRRSRIMGEEPKPPKLLTEDELKALKGSDPESAADYIAAVKIYERDKRDWDNKKASVQQQEQSEATVRFVRTMATSFISAAHDLLKIETDQISVEDMLDGKSEQPQAVTELLNSPEFRKVVEEIDANPQAYRDKEGNLTPRMVRMIYKDLNGEKIAKAEKFKGAKESLRRRAEASNGGSILDKGGSAEKGKSGFINTGNLSQDDIRGMDEKSVDALLEKEGIH